MLKRRKNVVKFCLRYDVDLWGRLMRRNTNNKKIQVLVEIMKEYVMKRNKSRFRKYREKFVYRIDKYKPKRRRVRSTFSREMFIMKRKLQKFYCNIKQHQFRRYAKSKTYVLNYKYRTSVNFKKYLDYQYFGNVNFLSIIEHRLDVILFRSNFAISMQQSRQFIQHRHVLVNGQVIYSCNYNVKDFDIISLKPQIEKKMRKILTKKLKQNQILCYPPVYLGVDYRLMLALINKVPSFHEIPFPFKTHPNFLMGLSEHK